MLEGTNAPMAMDAAEIWRHCFSHWPVEMERHGVLVTSYGEQIAFDSFAISQDMLLIERRTPDNVGARLVLIAFQNIQALKIVDVVKMKAFGSMGFAAPPPKK